MATHTSGRRLRWPWQWPGAELKRQAGREATEVRKGSFSMRSPLNGGAAASVLGQLTINLGDVTAALHAQTDVELVKARLAENEDGLKDLVPQRLGLHELEGGTCHGRRLRDCEGRAQDTEGRRNALQS